jgi:Phage integrase family
MNRILLSAMIAAITVLTAVFDFFTSAKLLTVALFIFPLILCVAQRSKWLLWTTAALAMLQSAAAGTWGFHQVTPVNPWVVSANRALIVATLLALTIVIHLWINKSQKAILGIAKMERHSISLTVRIEQLENDLMKFKAAAKGKPKPIVLTIKQYQAFAGQLSDLHRTMVVAAMCSGMRISEVLALRWEQLDLSTGLIAVQPGVMNSRIVETDSSGPQLPMDRFLVDTFSEWRNKSSGSGLVFPSHITGRCYHPGPIQQDYFKPVARKLGMTGICWQTFPNSYKSWLAEDATPEGVHQRLTHQGRGSTPINHHVGGTLKSKGKANGKVSRHTLPTTVPRVTASADAS